MPELPEVETVRRGLSSVSIDRAISGGEVLLPRSIAHPAGGVDFIENLSGSQIVSWHRRGKYLYAALQRKNRSSGWLGVHLRMTGQMLWLERETPLVKHTRVRLFVDDKWELRFVDQRTFGQMWWIPADVQPTDIMTGMAKLGPEPFDPEFSIEYFTAKLQKSHRNIKTAILDQALVAGLGNIYADESLFISRIHPQTIARSLKPAQISALHRAAIDVLKLSIERGGTSFSNYLNVEGVNGNYGGEAWVYGRTDSPCRVCGSSIVKIRLGGRGTHYCPQCQPETKG
jgi:formamidopyrimidine-DNA glycosylase